MSINFFDDKPSKSRPRNFFKDFGCIVLFKTLTILIRAIIRLNPWPNQTCKGDKLCQWKKEEHDCSRAHPPKKTHIWRKIQKEYDFCWKFSFFNSLKKVVNELSSKVFSLFLRGALHLCLEPKLVEVLIIYIQPNIIWFVVKPYSFWCP